MSSTKQICPFLIHLYMIQSSLPVYCSVCVSFGIVKMNFCIGMFLRYHFVIRHFFFSPSFSISTLIVDTAPCCMVKLLVKLWTPKCEVAKVIHIFNMLINFIWFVYGFWISSVAADFVDWNMDKNSQMWKSAVNICDSNSCITVIGCYDKCRFENSVAQSLIWWMVNSIWKWKIAKAK